MTNRTNMGNTICGECHCEGQSHKPIAANGARVGIYCASKEQASSNMKTIRVGDVIEWSSGGYFIDGLGEYTLYLFRDDDCVFYVGKTERHVLERLAEHLRAGSALGELVRDNLPSSLNWEIDLYCFQECASLVKKHLRVKMSLSEDQWRRGVQLGERALIREYHPALNVQHADDETDLPDRYRIKRAERQRAMEILLKEVGWI